MHRLPKDQRRMHSAYEMQTGLIGLVRLIAMARGQMSSPDQWLTWTQVPPYKSPYRPATNDSTAWRVYCWEPRDAPEPGPLTFSYTEVLGCA